MIVALMNVCVLYNDNGDGQWIECDSCDKWFHVTCVNLSEGSLIELVLLGMFALNS